MKIDWKKKLTSRKFIIAVITAIAGIVTLIFGHGEEVNTIAGALMTVIPTLVYCIVEGTVDAASVKKIGNAVSDAAEQLGAKEISEQVDQLTDLAEAIVDEANGGETADSNTEDT